jgi:hypothetical protein
VFVASKAKVVVFARVPSTSQTIRDSFEEEEKEEEGEEEYTRPSRGLCPAEVAFVVVVAPVDVLLLLRCFL